MNEYKYQLRLRKRGGHCLINGGSWGKICGCGGRTPPTKQQKNRIVRRALKRLLEAA